MAETKEIQYTDLRFIPTGIVFHLPVNDAKEVLASDRGNFEVVGGVDITEDEEIIEEVKKQRITFTVEAVRPFFDEMNVLIRKYRPKVKVLEREDVA